VIVKGNVDVTALVYWINATRVNRETDPAKRENLIRGDMAVLLETERHPALIPRLERYCA
jgi:hypothetical protein